MTTSDLGLADQLHQRVASGNTIQKVITPILTLFDKIVHRYVLFNVIFLVLGFIEFVLIIFFFTFLTKSAVLAFSLAALFLTFFSYFILRVYNQAQKPEQLYELKERYIRACKGVLNYQEHSPDHLIALANALAKFSDALSGREYTLIHLPSSFSFLQKYVERFSCWFHWQDVHQMRELLLKASVDENIKLVKLEPTSLESHAALANSYIMLSSLYIDPKKHEKSQEEKWVPEEAFSPELAEKFRWVAERAIEEFKIINDFAPGDPWVHAQLAYSYHDLKMPKEEIREYEILLEIDPGDSDTLVRLGILYFQQGMNANGLRIYERLKELDLRRADELMKYYGSYRG